MAFKLVIFYCITTLYNIKFFKYVFWGHFWSLFKVFYLKVTSARKLFFVIKSPIKMKFGQILVCCMTNISNIFLAECWRLETCCRFFYDFIKMIIQQDLAIFNGWHIPFLIVLYSPFQKRNTGILACLVIE